MHTGVNPRLEQGGPRPGSGTQWFHMRQDKHHRWSLDEPQIYQYHLGGALHPHIRWWEATDVPPRTIGFMEAHELTVASLVCEDLAQSDNVAEVIRSVGLPFRYGQIRLTRGGHKPPSCYAADGKGCSPTATHPIPASRCW